MLWGKEPWCEWALRRESTPYEVMKSLALYPSAGAYVAVGPSQL